MNCNENLAIVDSFENKFEEYKKIADDAIIKYSKEVALCDSSQNILYEAQNYSLLLGGKRIRPILMLAVCDSLGCDINKCIPFAVAIEMIHTYSLVHDDLPAIDNDIIRRGNPTTHIKFGEALGIFAGDGLLTDAIEIMVNACKDESAKDALECFNKIEAMRIIVAAAGGKGMLGGQVIDKQYEDDSIPLDLLETMHRLKTGSLIKASVLTAATICNADNETKDGLEHFSDELGLAFQIKDDILDAEGDCQTLGKTVGKDLINNKKTYASMYGIEKAKILLEEKSNSACAHLKEISRRLPDADFAFLVDLTCYLASRQL